jgi:hypothetical protein
MRRKLRLSLSVLALVTEILSGGCTKMFIRLIPAKTQTMETPALPEVILLMLAGMVQPYWM